MANELIVKIGADISGLDAGVQNATRTVSGFGDTLKGAFLGSLGADLASRAFGAITESITGAIHALAEVDKIAGQTAAVIASTGGAAGITADQVGQLADALERKTGIEAESIAKGENLLLTFTNIKNAAGANNDIFNQATGIMADLATAMGGDASGAAIQLGKALNDPTAGVTALTRVGVTFTDAQKTQIKAMQDAGDLMGAQKVVLAELRKEFGGSAEAAGKTFAGALDRAKNAVDSISEAMVGPAVPVFTRALGKVADAAYAVSDAITQGDLIGLINRAFGPGSKALVVGLATVIGASLVPQMANVTRQAAVMAASYLRGTASMVAANAPLIAAIAAVSFAAYPFIKNWDTVAGLFSLTWTTITNAVNSAWQTIAGATRNALEIISANFRSAYSNVMAFFLGPLARGFKTLFDALPQQVKDAVGGLKFEMPKFEMAGAGAAFQSLKDAATPAFKYVSALAGTTVDNFKSTWGGLPGEIKAILSQFNGLVAGSASGAVKQLKTIGDASNRMGDQVKDAHEAAAKGVKAHGSATKDLKGEINDALPALFNFILKAGQIKKLLDTEITWKRIEKETADYVKQQNDLNKVADDAKKKIEDLDKVAKYWADTTDRTAEKQGILRDAINTLINSGVNPASPLVAGLRDQYDKLSIATDTAKAKTYDFNSEIGNMTSALTATAGLLSLMGSGDGPVGQFVGVMQSSLGAMQNFQSMTKGIESALGLAGQAGFIGAEGIGATSGEIGIFILFAAKFAEMVDGIAKALGGWPMVLDGVIAAFQAMGWGFAWIGENVLGATINALGQGWTGFVNLFKSGANLVINAVNAIIDAINTIQFDIPDWVPQIGGQKWGANIRKISTFAMEEFAQVQFDFTSGLGAGIQETLGRMGDRAAKISVEQGGGTKIADDSKVITDNLTAKLDQIDRNAAPGGRFEQPKIETAKFAEAYRGMIEGANALMQRGIDTGDLSLQKRAAAEYKKYHDLAMGITEEQPKKYSLMGLGAANTTKQIAEQQRMEASFTAPIQQRAMGWQSTPTVVEVNYYGNGKWTREDAQALGALIVNELKTSGVR